MEQSVVEVKVEETDQSSFNSSHKNEQDQNGSDSDKSHLLFDPPSLLQLKSEYGWKHAIIQSLVHYFPHYKLKKSGKVQIEERPIWYQSIAYGIQHVLAMFSGVIIIPLIVGYDQNACLFFSGVNTILFFIITGGRVPSYLGCSGSFTSVLISVTGYVSGRNNNIASFQGALLILSLVYILFSVLVMLFGFQWLEFLMPPVVTGAVVTAIGLHLSFIAYQNAATSTFDTYMALFSAMLTMLFFIYLPVRALRRIALLLGAIVSYVVYCICGLKGIGPGIDFTDLQQTPWLSLPTVRFELKFDPIAIGSVLPIIIVVLAENLGHMKAIGSITGRPMMRYVGRAYLGDAISCLISSLTGTLPMTTYAENIGILSVTQMFSPLVIVIAGLFSVLVGFISKFGAVIRSIPQGVLGGLSIILYALIAVTGIRIWVVNKVDFEDTRNVFVAGVPILLAVIFQTPIKINDFQLDGIGIAAFSSIILYQLLVGYQGLFGYGRFIRDFFNRNREN
ncbi:hypothetical protein K501DRAFT_255421 [Backusella circina FSU 941]|nr:hypothetical protein K501DRAFT_255421 [Backusella circina FSU 941]